MKRLRVKVMIPVECEFWIYHPEDKPEVSTVTTPLFSTINKAVHVSKDPPDKPHLGRLGKYYLYQDESISEILELLGM